MTSSRAIHVTIDDRARLMSALLAVSSWPEVEQKRRRHRAHVHARRTSRWVGEFTDHPAVHTLQTLLDQGTPLEALFSYALSLSWPDGTLQAPIPWAPLHWDEQIVDFWLKAELASWWAEEDEAWQLAYEQSQNVIADVDLYTFLQPFVGPVAEQLVFMPNISYPSDAPVGLRLDGALVCIAPPRIAWGDNEPWPFDEDPAHIFRAMLAEYGRLLMVSYLRQKASVVATVSQKPLPVDESFRETHPTWADQFTSLFVGGAVAIFLEQALGVQEAKAYILMEHRVNGMTSLPSVVSVLKRYLADHDQGRYEQLADYLPSFPNHLRVAKSMASL